MEFFVVLTDFFCSVRLNIFFTCCRPFNSLLCELSVPAVWQLNLLLKFCSSLENHKTLYNFIPVHWVFSDGWSLLTEWVDSKYVISVWVLTEKGYMFRWMLPRLFSKTITKVILIVSLNILKYTVAYSFQFINPKLLETRFFCGPL